MQSVEHGADVLPAGDERDQAAAELRTWGACFDYLADILGGRLLPERPTNLELLRWGPGGRRRFGDPRPGDYMGRDGAT
jgi:hypothetical protein